MSFAKSLVKTTIPAFAYPIARSAHLWIRKQRFKGSDVYCPCCKGSYTFFLTGGYTQRANAVCPGCGLLERHRLLWLYLENCTNLFDSSHSVLHIAPESIFEKRLSSIPELNYLSADLIRPAMVQMDITSIQYDDASFDVILCSHVLEHIPDDQKAIQELFRVLKPNGWAIIQVPIDNTLAQTYEDTNVVSDEERLRLFGHHDHKRLYGQDYKKRLEKAGFQVKIDKFAQTFSDNEIIKYGVQVNEDVYYCTRM